jgi:hypothetical protein
VIDLQRRNLEEELFWREATWAAIQRHPNWPDLDAAYVREMGLYNGSAGIYADFNTTRALGPEGAAVSVKSSGRHYADDVDEDGMIYDYPTTLRSATHDANEITSVKNAGVLGLPIFVILERNKIRNVQLAQVSDFDDVSRCFLFEFGEHSSEKLVIEVDAAPFEIEARRNLSTTEITRIERSPRFKFETIKRYRGVCAVSEIAVLQMLDGAHVVPVKNGGSDDLRNGLLLSASHHRAFDANLWAIKPETLEIVTRPDGPTLLDMRITQHDLGYLVDRGIAPHPAAIERRYELFEKSLKKAS